MVKFFEWLNKLLSFDTKCEICGKEDDLYAYIGSEAGIMMCKSCYDSSCL